MKTEDEVSHSRFASTVSGNRVFLLEPGVVCKEFAFPIVWLPVLLMSRPLERKSLRSILSARARWKRDLELTKLVRDIGINTYEIIGEDSVFPSFSTRRISHEQSLLDYFQSSGIHYHDKLEYFNLAVQTIRKIHNLKLTGKLSFHGHNGYATHGDSFLKNFNILPEASNGNKLHIFDFEMARTSPEPAFTDLLILTADSASQLKSLHKDQNVMGDLCNIIKANYGVVNFPFTKRDYLYFSFARFNMKKEFFKELGYDFPKIIVDTKN